MKDLRLKLKFLERFLKLPKSFLVDDDLNSGQKFLNLKLMSLLDNIFNSTSDLITFMGTDLKYLMCSKRFLEVFNYKLDSDVIGKSYEEVLPQEQVSEVKKHLNSVLKEKCSKVYLQNFNINGKEVLFESVSSPLILCGHVLGVLTLTRNISEIVYLRKSLEISNTTLYALVNNAPYIAYVLDKDGNFVNGNAQAKQLFEEGIDVLETGQKIQLDMRSPEFLKIIHENSDLIKSGKNLDTERQLTSITGEKFWYKLNKSPIKDSDGEFCAVVTFIKNIDTEKRAQEQRETYIATLSHDLKTPAIAQVRALELLLSGQFGEFNQEQKEILQTTLDSCNYMYEMVYTILSTCKFESGAISLNYTSFDIIPIIIECIHEVSNYAIKNSTTVEFEPKMSECIVCADKIEIKRVIINLLSNAINYAFPSTKVSLTLNTFENNLDLRVINSSPYIEPIALERLFSKYVTNAEKFNKVGFGLGLYLSKKIIEEHNGTIIAESSKTQNNTFGFNIPLTPKTAFASSNI
jgi:PAS domain S-box-containing protein